MNLQKALEAQLDVIILQYNPNDEKLTPHRYNVLSQKTNDGDTRSALVLQMRMFHYALETLKQLYIENNFFVSHFEKDAITSMKVIATYFGRDYQFPDYETFAAEFKKKMLQLHIENDAVLAAEYLQREKEILAQQKQQQQEIVTDYLKASHQLIGCKTQFQKTLDNYYAMLGDKDKSVVEKIVLQQPVDDEDKSRVFSLLTWMNFNNIDATRFPTGYAITWENKNKFHACALNPNSIKIFDDYVTRCTPEAKPIVEDFYNTSLSAKQIAEKHGVSEDLVNKKLYKFYHGFGSVLKGRSTTAPHLVFCLKNNITLGEFRLYGQKLRHGATRENLETYLEMKTKPFGEQTLEHEDGSRRNLHAERLFRQVQTIIDREKK